MSYNAEIVTRKIDRNLKYDEKDMVQIDIEYPNVILKNQVLVQTRINISYSRYARDIYRNAVRVLLPQAIQQYKDFQKQGYPFNAYDVVVKYFVSQNSNCTLSTYSDNYEYTGGAHGNTIRTSENWNLKNGQKITMPSLFRGIEDYKTRVIKQIQIQAEKNMEDDPHIYFDDYKKLIADTFNEKSFYLTQTALNVYYQQYDIAPYSSGIIVFSIPFAVLGVKPPSCQT